MAFFADLEPCSYFGRFDSERLLAVGWLAGSRPYARGAIPDEARRRLLELVGNIWSPFYFMGVHRCELCSGADGTANLFVPGSDVVYVAPELVEHYIDAHDYRPPRSFLDAVEQCPSIGTDTYFSALIEAGGSDFAKFTRLVPEEPTPCPFCGKPLITPRAQQCNFCKTDWHDPRNPRPMQSI